MPRSKHSNLSDFKDSYSVKKSPFVLDLRKHRTRDPEEDRDNLSSKGGEVPMQDVGKESHRVGRELNPRKPRSFRGGADQIHRESFFGEGTAIFREDEVSKDKILEKFSQFEEYEARLASMLNKSNTDSEPNRKDKENNFVLKLIPERKNIENPVFPRSTSKYDVSPFMNNSDANPDNPYGSGFVNTVRVEDAADYREPYLKKELVNGEKFFDRQIREEKIQNQPSPAPGVRKRISNFALISGMIAIVVFGVFYVQGVLSIKERTVNDGFRAYEKFKQAQESFENFDFKKAAGDFSGALISIEKAQESVSEIGNLTVYVAQNIPFDSHAESAISLLNAAKHIALAGESLSFGFSILPLDELLSPESIINLFSRDKDSISGYSAEVFERFNEQLQRAEFEVISAKDELENVHVPDFPAELHGNIKELKQKVPAISNLISTLRDYSKISGNLLGKDSKKRYLVLFQNSSEIRPTGGFIGSYAILEFQGGKLTDMFVDGIYNADGRLTVNIIPPKPFEHITTAWSTHDANWFFDFPLSAEKTAWFFEKTGGGNIDGVITLNVEVVEDLLKITGPINLPGYDIVLNSENFRDEIQYEVEVAYDKKANRPKQILADFAPIFIDNLAAAVKNSSKEILRVAFENLDAKNVMFYFKDEDIQKFFDGQGWTGRIADIKCKMPDAECNSDDYLAVVHSNIGGYKTSKFMEERVSYEVEVLEDGSLVANVKIERRHNGGDLKYWWYNRSNIDYVKIYAPKNSELISYSGGIRRDNTSVPDYDSLGFTKDLDVSLVESSLTKSGTMDIFNESAKTVFATWLITKPKQNTILEVRYRLPFKIEIINSVGKYDLKIQKQGGTELNFSVKINIPKSWEIEWNNLDILSSEHSFVLNKDEVIGYIFKK